MRIQIYDTTLRDGSQGEGVNFSLQDKLLIAKRLDELGVDFVEGGYPLSNEKDAGNQRKILTETFRQSTLLAAGLAMLLSGLIPFVVTLFFGRAYSQATIPAVILALGAALTASGNILNQGLRGAGRPHAGLLSQMLGTGVLVLAAALLLKPFGLVGMAWAVAFGAAAQITILVAAAANWLRISPLQFWPFGLNSVRNFFQTVVALRPRILRSPA